MSIICLLSIVACFHLNVLGMLVNMTLRQGSAAAYLVSIDKCSAHPLLAHV